MEYSKGIESKGTHWQPAVPRCRSTMYPDREDLSDLEGCHHLYTYLKYTVGYAAITGYDGWEKGKCPNYPATAIRESSGASMPNPKSNGGDDVGGIELAFNNCQQQLQPAVLKSSREDVTQRQLSPSPPSPLLAAVSGPPLPPLANAIPATVASSRRYVVVIRS
uniref:Uncharacterized protein n=1 Tax=Oryza sativa subsp. japonica TaxID=39947 RepID=Q84MT9_ORYSJ|nr:hypothetical protein [Oryza sativa Japonica Group]